MRSIAIIGSGQAGLLAAHALLKWGYQVTLYSDRTPEQWLNESRPTGTAQRFDIALQFEYELGLNSWENDAPWGEGAHITMCPVPGNRMLTLAGRLRRPFLGIDLRLQSHAWMHELTKRGGRIVIESVDVARLDQIAAENDLTIVATGRADLCKLFERDAARSIYDKPQRHLAMVCIKGIPYGFDGIPFTPVKQNIIGPAGEIFFGPYYHKDAGPSWAAVLEAKPGGPMDRFEGMKQGDQVLETAKKVVQEFAPWDYEWIKNAELSDPLGWLVGKFAPTVRNPVGKLPSGRLVTCVGDTAMALDPIGGQGANNGNKMVRNLVECVLSQEDRPFDAQWMTETFERFYARHGRDTYAFNHSLLEPPTPAAFDFLLAQYGSDGRFDNSSGPQLLANAFVENANDPGLLTPLLTDRRRMHQFIEKVTGRSWMRAVAGGAMGVAREEFRQLRGQQPRHPVVAEYKIAA
ncbi:styrene monooxygenase/indole monooxygenase family protein [Hyalangium rubrum]|uniref:Styrene monooxygenase/indole monooxygenase family protein n=1 Tax=Hyalangium rubrum TaxID=3103134 RepID=A0ABU5GUD0_9BACT|nr:styrene monooxygenase/indole monooxygenase family protein [Hyalangium sp. s54d21]MDY7224781.1 styrene monooxygenase/indole monooxygenase family protein [Hyalangium sp. s54d21]